MFATGTSIKSGGVKLDLRTQTSLLVKKCGHANVFQVWVKCLEHFN